ncbi:acyl-CoA dehydrogenase family protein [Sphingobacterium psychroaquaticum]|uniref:Acyl-CoA dehydrogenase, middle domain n=1 Tax=Sphingobacterium psychroaquaticum TaxID=561061 RepID=A0A1X7KNK1_9SPHI|nr:acyl-CoA dehydrogenase family protein [Sphingobacterium psychroaquaticum]QBQ40501.1 acyl-CoA dehydrogenase [Sphingobacterium psychroaquaticum]SMG42773.1 Acyl-CoA dehydrogenase, middle domain [Sphingobacterium psychroaquaticum]
MKSPYFNEDHEMFRASVQQFVKKIKPQFETWEENHLIPKTIWGEMGEMGYLGLIYPEQYGGMAADFFTSVVLIEEIAKGGNTGFGTALGVHAYMATNHINHIGSEDLKQKYLVPSIKGDLLGAIAFTEPNAGSDLKGIKTYAVRDGDDYVINGSKTYITNGCMADYFVTLCKNEEGKFDLIVIEGDDKDGLTRNKLHKLGQYSSDTAEIFFQDVRVPATNLIGEAGKGFYYVMESFQLERLTAAISTCATIEFALQITLDFMHERVAFGKGLTEFQALRHRIANHYTELEATKQLAYHTAWLFENGVFAVKEASMAKLKATELANSIIADCLQLHGGAGYMEDYLIARLFRDVKVGTIYGGTSEIMRDIIAKMTVDAVHFKKVY